MYWKELFPESLQLGDEGQSLSKSYCNEHNQSTNLYHHPILIGKLVHVPIFHITNL